jgi:hypothetical protein
LTNKRKEELNSQLPLYPQLHTTDQSEWCIM